MKKVFTGNLETIADPENLLGAWREFSRGKRSKPDVQEFALCLGDNILSLRDDILHHTYRHGGYQAFRIADPKPRDIHKATVRDRVLHHAVYRALYPFFDKTFATDSFSCRIDKGTHRALRRFAAFALKEGHNNTRTCWVLQCDIKKFFASIDHAVLMEILGSYLPDPSLVWLLDEVVESFSSTAPGKGLPLGNLTSQLFVNIYMNEFDQFVKHKMKAKYYIRYADDFVFLSRKRGWLEAQIPQIKNFLQERLKLQLHPDKLYIKTLASGIDFLGWVHFPDHRVLRTSTKKRMLRRIEETNGKEETVRSYLGLLSHGNAGKLKQEVVRMADIINSDGLLAEQVAWRA